MLSRSCARFIHTLNRSGTNNTLPRPLHPPSAAHARGHRPPCCGPNKYRCAMWSTQTNTDPVKKKRKNSVGSTPGSTGRVAWYENKKKKSGSGIPRLCSGCGVEIVSGSQRGGPLGKDRKMAAGEDAVAAQSSDAARSKRQERKARYADVLEDDGKSTLCGRCLALQGGDVWRAYDALRDVDAEVFSSQLKHIVARRQFGMCVVVVDATDPEFTSVRNLRDIVKGTPCILAVNKADLLPRALNKYDLHHLKLRVEGKRTKVIGAYGVSARTGEGVVDLAEGLLSHLAGRDVFVVGAANVGKSSLVRQLSSLLSRALRMRGRSMKADNKRRETLQNLRITRSHLPGTTLQAVRIPCFPSARHALWDTPGIINKAALAYSLFPSHLMEPLAFPKPIEIPTTAEEGGNGKKVRVKMGYSILIEAGWVADALEDAKDEDIASGESLNEIDDSSKEDQQHSDESDWHGDGDDDNVVSDELSNFKKEKADDGDGVAPFTLARLDIVEDNGMSVEALAFVPSCLTIRVVPTEDAPDVSAVPKAYVDKVQKLVGMETGNFYRDREVSRPFAVYKGDGNGLQKDGTVDFRPVEEGGASGDWIRRDVVFASLGWIMLNHRRPFTVRPWCVKESLWSKRKALYPSNLEDLGAEWDGDEAADYASMEDDDPAFEEIKRRLQRATEGGRHLADKAGKQRKRAGTTKHDSHRAANDDDMWW